jgi:hypothetical protein
MASSNKEIRLPERHGLTNTPLYGVWQHLRAICRENNTNEPGYKYYGAKGIRFCQEWELYSEFYRWASINGYKPGMHIRRKDKTKNYEPDNCFLSTKERGSLNRTIVNPWNLGEISLIEAVEKYSDLGYGGVYSRIYRRKWTLEKALSTPRKYEKKSRKS